PSSQKEIRITVQLASPLQVTVVSTRSPSENKPVKTSSPVQHHIAVSKTLRRKASESLKTTKKEGHSPPSNIVEKNNTAIEAKRTSIVLNNTQTESITEVVTKPDAEQATTKTDNSATLNHLRQQLKQSIRARFTYPRIARRMGWEGLVGLSLQIKNDGTLNKIRIARSSGHKVLDENARKTIQSIGRLQIASNLTMQSAETEIEVLYTLTD
ncbi:MAG: TonB family protein, partial [Gammaproteobacteria bacterium]|nr:TonB family protein [Gammaproteobacteria bacterium]